MFYTSFAPLWNVNAQNVINPTNYNCILHLSPFGLFLYGTVECHDIGFKDKSGPCYGNSSTGGNLGSIMESDVSDVMLHDDIVESTCSDVIWMQEDHEM